MCNPAVAQFGLSAAGQVGGFMSQRAAVRARNRARLQNFREENIAYYNDVTLRNTQWKNDLQDTEVAYNNIFQQTAEAWRQQDLAIEQAYDQAAKDNIDILQEVYRKEYAGTQTGVTAARLANEPIRKGGIKLTESMQKAIRVTDEANLRKEILTNDANRRRKAAYLKTWRSPVPGFTPRPPALESMPSAGGLILGLASSAVGAFGNSMFSSNPGITNSVSNYSSLGGTFNTGYAFQPLKIPFNTSSWITPVK